MYSKKLLKRGTRGIRFYCPKERNGVLGNYYPSPSLAGRSRSVKTFEHVYQALKFAHRRVPSHLIATCGSPDLSKQLARRFRKIRAPEFDRLKLEIMSLVVRARCLFDEPFRCALQATGNRNIVEWSGEDRFWSADQAGGANWMGVILMDQRARLRTKRRTAFELDRQLSLRERRFIMRTMRWLRDMHVTRSLGP
jgi:ribA/ribD-fused uncharacterized protein